MHGTKCRCEVFSLMLTAWWVRELPGLSNHRQEWDDPAVQTVRVLARGDGPPTFALAPRPGELPVAVWRLDHAPPARGRRMAHVHDFPMLVYSEDARGTVPAGGRGRSVAAGDVFVVAPGEVVGPFDTAHPVTGRGWSVSFTAEALGPDVPGSALAWRSDALLFPLVRGGAA